MLTHARWCLFLWLVVSPATALIAQNQREQREDVRLSGTLKDMRPGLLQIEATDGETWIVKVDAPREDISFAGTAELEWLRPGMWISFQTNLTMNRRYQTDGPIGLLKVFTPSKEMEPGIFPQMSLGEGLFSDVPPEQQVDKNKPVPCTVNGRIATLKKNKLTVAAGNVSLNVEVTDDLRIAVELSDLSLAQAGDQVSVEGWKYAMVPGRAVARKITVTGDKPLTAARAKKGRPTVNDKKDDKKKKKDTEGRDGDKPAPAP